MQPSLLLISLLLVLVATSYFVASNENECTTIVVHVFPNGESTNGRHISFCRESCSVNPVLSEFLCSQVDESSECSFFNEKGVEIETCSDLDELDIKRLFVVPKERIFVFPPFEIGHMSVLDHIRTSTSDYNKVIIETLSISPRVFRLHNYLSENDADELVNTALAQTAPDHILRRSSVGTTGYTQSSHRTSENAFDTSSDASIKIKKRGFDLLAIRPFDETFADGIQILRYNQTAAYIQHMDWLDPGDPEHDYESGEHGTNRLATVFLYLTDVEEGGETVFVNAERTFDEDDPFKHLWRSSSEEVEAAVDQYLERYNASSLFQPDSWERRLITLCKTKLAVKPKRATALLFYSQLPNGQPDPMSEHGACPVIEGVKWGANVWVWNGPRKGYTQRNPHTGMMELNEGGRAHSTWGWFRKQAPDIEKYITNVNPVNDGADDQQQEQADSSSGSSSSDTKDYGFPVNSVATTFMSADPTHSRLALYWQDQFFADIYLNQALTINSYAGHTWHLKSVGDVEEVLATWTVRAYTDDETNSPHIQPQQVFTYQPAGGGEWAQKTNAIPEEIDDADYYDEL